MFFPLDFAQLLCKMVEIMYKNSGLFLKSMAAAGTKSQGFKFCLVLNN